VPPLITQRIRAARFLVAANIEMDVALTVFWLASTDSQLGSPRLV
jgi:hypothetical protein